MFVTHAFAGQEAAGEPLTGKSEAAVTPAPEELQSYRGGREMPPECTEAVLPGLGVSCERLDCANNVQTLDLCRAGRNKGFF